MRQKLKLLRPKQEINQDYDQFIQLGIEEGKFMDHEALEKEEEKALKTHKFTLKFREALLGKFGMDKRPQDDLTVQAIAKFKILNESNLYMFDELDKQKLDLSRAKGIAFEDSEIEEEARLIDRAHERNELQVETESSVQANSEDTENKDPDNPFWQKFATNKETRRLTKLYLEKQEVRRKQEEEDQKLITQQFELNNQLATLEARLKSAETECRSLKLQQTHMAVEYFKENTKEVLDMFNEQQCYMFDRYFELKNKASQMDATIGKMGRKMSE